MQTSLKNGGQDVYSSELMRLLQAATLLMPVFVIFLGLCIKFGLLEDKYYYSDTAFYLTVLGFSVVATLQAILKRPSRNTQAIYMIAYHVLGVIFLSYVSGYGTPAAASWIALVIASEILFGKQASFLSIATLALSGGFFLLQLPNLDLGEVASVVILVSVTGFITWFISHLRSLSENERVALHHSQSQEVLQRDRLTTLVNAMSDAVITTDERGVVRMYNAATLNLLDTNKTLSGLSINKIIHLYDENHDPVKMKTLLTPAARVNTRDYMLRYQDGELVNLDISVSAIRPTYHQKSQHGFIIVLRDITKEKSLDDERDEFISVVSHELRTPIAIAEGNLSNLKYMLEHDTASSSPAVMSQAVESSHEQIMYLARMINDLSTLSRADRGVADNPERIDVNQLLEDMYNKYRPEAESKNIALNLDMKGNLGSVFVSRLYLEEILQNFITNGIKYTPEGSITVGAKKLPQDRIEFWVQDTGIGMSKSDQKHVFEKFYRSEDYRTRETSGTGLGLYVVAKLSYKLRTNIQLQSRLNHGSTFSFILPTATDTAKK